MNAASAILGRLRRPTIRRLTGRKAHQSAVSREELEGLLEGDLVALLNHLQRAELNEVAEGLGVSSEGTVGELRMRLWNWGAVLEAGGSDYLGSRLQPMPRILRSKLRVLGAMPGIAPAGPMLPRPVPQETGVLGYESEPESLEELLDRASSLIGVRLGQATRDKGAYGTAVAEILGLVEEGHHEPDWRGEVEIKTVPVSRDSGGVWFVKEDPAVSMEGQRPLVKLRRVLWVARVADEVDAPILSWFYQERSDDVTTLMRRDLHTRPKGGAGDKTRGWYLHKRFFVDCGLLLSLNG